MEKIVLDTNILMAVFELKIDIFEEIKKACDFNYELFILDKTVDELEKFIKGPLLSKKQAASFAMKLVNSDKIKILPTEGLDSVDENLLKLKNCIVATVDKDLKKSLEKNGVKIITIRQKRYVVCE